MAEEIRNGDMERFRRFQEVVRVDKLDKGSTALIIVDAQNDFVHDQGYFGKMAEELLIDVKFMREAIPHIKKLAEAMRQAGATVIYSQTMYEQDYADLGAVRLHQPIVEEPRFLVKGSWGAQIVEELKPEKGDYVVEGKSHSKFPYTPLELILRNKGIKTLIFTGYGTDGCVEATIRDAVRLLFRVIITSNGTGSVSRQLHEWALRSIGWHLGAVMTCEEVIKLLQEM